MLRDLAAAAESEVALWLAHRDALLAAARTQTILDCAHDAFVSVDAGGHITGWNTAAEQLCGWSAAEVLGRPRTDLVIPARFRAACQEALARLRDGRSRLAGRHLELVMVHRAGTEFAVEMTLQRHVEHGEAAFHAFVRDITDRKAAQAAVEQDRQRLADEQSFLQTLLDSLDTGVAACDADGRLVPFNKALRDVHGAGPHSARAGQRRHAR
ncbi:PAS domain-containing protein [Dactylosporangium sp. NPDC051541]|uniref:PAS domain-containing protein n=1 Tax=Dactylosporangium sp. NPDC051541 TaxID=3363977 RepID=UPI0037B53EED